VIERDQLVATEFGASDLRPGVYFWRVRATASSGQASDWSDPLKFIVATRGTGSQVSVSNLSAELLGEHLKNVCQALETKARCMTIALDVNESMVRHADIPLMPVGDMRQALKNNPKAYLQQDLPEHVFDCIITTSNGSAKAGTPDTAKASLSVPRQRVLVAGAKNKVIEDVQSAVKSTGLLPDSIVPGLLGPVNAFEMAMPEVFAKEAVALVDIGFRSTSICLLQAGELVLSRVVGIGGDRLTTGLAEALDISYGEAESIKLGIASEVQSQMEALIFPLGRELRASMDCFEHQQDRPITQVFVSGASAKSDLILQTLRSELMVECKTWNPLSFLQLALPPDQVAEIDQVASQLTVAVGSAMAAF
jgi:type IV pilus assembly protein PilM